MAVVVGHFSRFRAGVPYHGKTVAQRQVRDFRREQNRASMPAFRLLPI